MFGKRLKKLIKENDMLQKEFAKEIGFGKSTISMWIKGDREPDNKTLNEIADFFGVSVDYLLGRTDIKKPADKMKDKIPKETLELLDDEDIEFLIELSQDDQRQLLMRESRKLTDKDLAKIIKTIRVFSEEEDVPPEER